jgi:hypothetical protein
VPYFAHTGHTMPTRQRDGRLLAQHLELWQRIKDRQSAQSIGLHGTMAAKSGKQGTELLSGLLLCEHCGSRFIASNQHGYQCATRTYGGLSACANETRINRERAATAIVDYISDELLSPEAIALAQRVYEKASQEAQSALQSVVQAVPDHLLGEENRALQEGGKKSGHARRGTRAEPSSARWCVSCLAVTVRYLRKTAELARASGQPAYSIWRECQITQ